MGSGSNLSSGPDGGSTTAVTPVPSHRCIPKVPNIHAASVCEDILFTPIIIRLSLRTSTSIPTTHYASTQMKFTGLPGTTPDMTGSFTAITDQSASTYFSKQAARVGGHAFVSDGCGEVDESDDTPLQKYTQR